ncbi:MAG: Na+/H+ antiporter NhaC [Prolixibacteraceae bacterium]|jgi:NhaC family Na+:H+ antiporter|nr:Na+/H+ antiporter NhaC [Prolixibacteraceae bacterium]MDI9565156.1 Na+/H+ antiporter NhaC [Bacteroidota bacterium]NLS98597.1 Na+/H+ antiporter NhaC [Bacteroidales bacterium]OQB81322.1 MAG: Malate-2H(+)/Na(+)-lactate antiporter [Bacteroidetes bacterium ADurb.Bin123]HNU76764.1 Na+/H+ antiporter NhaC [Prolixibacteraceae bacterium]
MKKERAEVKITIWEALIPLVALIGMLTANVFIFEDTLAGSNQMALLLAAAIASLLAFRLGISWKRILKKMVNTIHSAMPAILILLIIGALAGAWMISGVVPAMIYYGLDIISPRFFLVTAVVVGSIVSVATGSSWSTVATIGVALLGIGKAIGISDAVVAGAIISGAYFGDKMSPLSDTTNLAPAMAGTDVFTHVRYMVYTTTPSVLLTLGIFLVFGFSYDFSEITVDVTNTRTVIGETFNINLWLFLVPLFLLAIIILKVPPLPALLAGALAGALFAIIFQPHIIAEVAGGSGNPFRDGYHAAMQAMFGQVNLTTRDAGVNELLSTTGMRGMLDTIWLILSAMIFGGAMEAAGFLRRITRPIIRYARRQGSLVAATVGTCIFFNFTASDQYISIVIPGRMYRKAYADQGLKPEVLSRALEDAGTMTSVLIPWNTCGATQSRVLGVATFDYLPYCFLNLISPLMSIFFAVFNIKIRRIDQKSSGHVQRTKKEDGEPI